ncbi:MAG: hypothetical protein PUC68_01150 [Firmicutes bacterium]|nr:hypothetical protein [Bacillota bacterium]
MRKLITSLLSILLLCCMLSSNVFASSSNLDDSVILDTQTTELDWSNDGLENAVITNRNIDYESRTNYSSLPPSVELDFIISSTGDRVHFERIGDIGYYYENDILITTIEYNTLSRVRATIPNSIKSLNFSAGSGFSNYYYSGYNDWVANHVAGKAVDKAVPILIAAIAGGLPTHLLEAAQSLYSVASTLFTYCTNSNEFSDDSLRAVNIYYGSYNGQCNILAWYGFKVYSLREAWSSEVDTSSGQAFKANANHTWNGTPYDYTQPSACRVLVNNYPY